MDGLRCGPIAARSWSSGGRHAPEAGQLPADEEARFGVGPAHWTASAARSTDGKVVTLRSNVRWCSDILEFMCWEGDLGRVAFALDCHDREVLGLDRHHRRDSRLTIRDVMVNAWRGGSEHPAHPIPCSGSPTMARSTRPPRPSTLPPG